MEVDDDGWGWGERQWGAARVLAYTTLHLHASDAAGRVTRKSLGHALNDGVPA